MSSAAVEWSCPTCNAVLDTPQRKHDMCSSLTRWRCLLTQRSGQYDKYTQHAKHCEYCSPELKDAIREEKESNKENRMAAVEDDENGHYGTAAQLHSSAHLSTDT